jgi:hypothetical protein
LPVPSQ